MKHDKRLFARKLLLGVHGGILVQALHEIALEKISRIIWGTWESNPGPNGHWTSHPPPSQTRAFVNIMVIDDNI